MKTWNTPVFEELAISSTAENGNTPTASDVNYKKKTNQCECTHNTNFQFSGACPNDHFKNEGSDTSTPDGLS